jgi:hypothetical protein
MRLELTIKTSYLPEWGIWEGIRELVQNGADAETEFGAKLTVRHRSESNTLVIENEGTTLPHEALLLGYTSKVGRGDMIGKFGEGLKLGILALVRKGAKVKIRSGSEVWVPGIVRSEKFNADVLAFSIHKNREDKQRVSVEIQGIDKEAWHLIRGKFLFLTPPTAGYRVDTHYGSILQGPDYVGKLYVRGILVQENAPYQYGYDMRDVEIDRDRKMIDQASLRWRLATLWRDALSSREDLVPEFLRLVDAQAQDVEGLDAYAAKQLPENVKATITQGFQKRHGENAIPVTNLAESAEVEHLGANGVVCPAALRAILETTLGTVADNKQKLSHLPQHKYSWSDLSTNEKLNLQAAIGLVNSQSPVTLADIDVCDFRDEGFQGLRGDGRVMLARKILGDADQTLSVLVHEVAHHAGSDGEKGHVMEIERIWSGIVAALRGAA